MHPKTPTASFFTRVATTFAIPLIAASTVVILIATLYPYTMDWGRAGDAAALRHAFQDFFSNSSDAEDIWSNILLFMPLGFGLACAGLIRRLPAWWLLTVLAGAIISFSIECLQTFLPSRAPTLFDILTNTFGAGLGVATFLLAQHLCSTRQRFAIVAAIVASALLLLTFPLQRAARLSTWDSSYPLSVGNDLSGSEQWTGTIRTLAISATATSPEQVVRLTAGGQVEAALPWLVRYDFTAPNPLIDQAGQQLALTPVNASPLRHGVNGLTLADSQSLMLQPQDLTSISAILQQAGRLTALIDVTAASPTQDGRIVAIAGDDGHLNLVLAQNASNLLVKIRTPATSEDGVPGLIVANVFADDQPHTIAVSYQQSVLRVAIDGHMRPETLQVTPAMVFFSRLLPYKANNVLMRYAWVPTVYHVLYIGLVFVPVGLVLALWVGPTWLVRSAWMVFLGGGGAILAYAGLVLLAGGPGMQLSAMMLQILAVSVAWGLFSRLLRPPVPEW